MELHDLLQKYLDLNTKLTELQTQITESRQPSSSEIDEIGWALALAQEKFTTPKKSKKGQMRGVVNYEYSTYEDLVKATRKALRENGLTVFHETERENGIDILLTIVSHKPSKQWLRSRVALDPDNPHDAQKKGSYMTYMLKYSYKAILGIAYNEDEDDDDGEVTGLPTPPVVNNLTDYQVKQLEDKLTSGGTNRIQGALNHFDVKSLKDLTLVQYKLIMN